MWVEKSYPTQRFPGNIFPRNENFEIKFYTLRLLYDNIYAKLHIMFYPVISNFEKVMPYEQGEEFRGFLSFIKTAKNCDIRRCKTVLRLFILLTFLTFFI